MPNRPNRRTQRNTITTIEGLVKFLKKELRGLKSQVSVHNDLLVAPSINKDPIWKPASHKRCKTPIISAIIDHLLEEGKFTFSDSTLKKVKANHPLSPKETRAYCRITHHRRSIIPISWSSAHDMERTRRREKK
ncbi:hypothetical protein [Absidia glauca]|uniref:Uncharacterized protein n=1 Tax=Absidia glauca TaxID=4829 RepID=A0A163JCF5_ABSGL|nr:hypothetical protein [Absidia glauca]